jgi:tripartite-type tricarboxylate transporter receptor subunit TctC
MLRRRSILGIASSLIAGALPLQAHAQYPSRQIRVVVPFPPGGPVDAVGRLVQGPLSERLGQNIIMDYRAGAGGTIGTDNVAKAAPDGHTLLLVASSHAMNPALFTKLPFDSEKDFAPVALIVISPFVLVVHPSVPVTSTQELIAYARSNPGKLNYASASNGSANHLGGELFKKLAGIDMTHVPYKGAAPALQDVIAGQAQVMFGPILTTMPMVEDKRLRALGVTSLKRVSIAPQLPTVAETVPDFEMVSWYGVLAPANTPPEIVRRLNTEINAVLKDPNIQRQIQAMGGEAAPGSPDAFGRFISAEMTKWGRVAKDANARLD